MTLDVFEGKLVEIEIDEPGWLKTGRLTDPDAGTSWRFVYRSPLVKQTSSLHQRVVDWLDGAEPVGNVRLHVDTEMMGGSAELTLWEP